MRRQEAVKEKDRIYWWPVRNSLGQVRESDQHQQDKRQGRQQGVERQGAGQEGNVVFVGGLERASQKAGG